MSTTTYEYDFAAIKTTVKWEQLLPYLGIKVSNIAPTKMRGKCPFCSDPKTFSVTTDAGLDGNGLANCFHCKTGGDMLELVSRLRGNSPKHKPGWKAAAKELTEQFLTVKNSTTVNSMNSTPKGPRSGFDPEAYAKELMPDHAALEALGVAPDTLREWKAGFCSSGPNRGKLALPVTRAGKIVHYVGRTLKDETPLLTFPNGVEKTEYIFGEEWVLEGKPLTLVRDPLDVLLAHERGEPNFICLLTETMAPQQLDYLSALMNQKKCSVLDWF